MTKKYIQVEEEFFNQLLQTQNQKPKTNHKHDECSCGGNCNCHKGKDLNDIVKKIEIKDENTKYYKKLTKLINTQINQVKAYVNETPELLDDPTSITEITERDRDTRERLNDNYNELNDVIEEQYEISKQELCDDINREMILRAVDDIDLALLKQYNQTTVDRLTHDVEETIYNLIVDAITSDTSLEELNEKLDKFITDEQLRGYQTTITRIKMITIDVITRVVATGTLQGMKDYNLNKLFCRPTSLNPCVDCERWYETSPHDIDYIKNKFPFHILCQCRMRRVYLEEPSDDPIEQAEYVNLCNYYREHIM